MSKIKEFFKSENIVKYFKKISEIFLIVCAFYLGYVSNDIYNEIKKSDVVIEEPKAPELRTISETSVAINERNELMIIDRKTGQYEIYQDSIGQVIFKLYSNKIYENITQ